MPHYVYWFFAAVTAVGIALTVVRILFLNIKGDEAFIPSEIREVKIWLAVGSGGLMTCMTFDLIVQFLATDFCRTYGCEFFFMR